MAEEVSTLEHVLALMEARFAASQRAVELALAGQRELVDARFNAQKEAVDKAERAADRRLESLNEFRGQLADQQRMLIPRAEAETILAAQGARIADLKERLDALQNSRVGLVNGWGAAVGALGVVLAVAAFLLKR